MKLLLTSSPCSPYPQEDGRILYGYNPENGFLQCLKEGWEPDCKCLMISSDPRDFSHNDKMRGEFEGFFEISKIPVSSLVICDERNERELEKYVRESRIVILAGGHVPTQNAFFQKIHLKEQIKDFQGTVMGISAGTMNCASLVYAQPELAGESVDPKYQRFLQGLSLTDLMILPHYQEVKDYLLDGKRLMEDITYEDSMGRTFYALVDGSYVLSWNGREVLHGEAYRIRDGKIQRICEKGESVVIKGELLREPDQSA